LTDSPLLECLFAAQDRLIALISQTTRDTKTVLDDEADTVSRQLCQLRQQSRRDHRRLRKVLLYSRMEFAAELHQLRTLTFDLTRQNNHLQRGITNLLHSVLTGMFSRP
jgi:hypothetical protein